MVSRCSCCSAPAAASWAWFARAWVWFDFSAGEGVGDAATSVVEALQAGVDLLLYPPEELPVREILLEARDLHPFEQRDNSRSCDRVSELPSNHRLGGRIGVHDVAGGISDPAGLEKEINNLPGVLENGLFVNITDQVLVGEINDGVAGVRDLVKR